VWIEEQALGALGMSVTDYELITLTQFFNKLRGYYDLALQREQAEWERTQYIEFIIMVNNPYIKESSKPRTFIDFKNRKQKQPVKKTIKITTKKQLEDFING